MRWINAPQSGGMDSVMESQIATLRDQMMSAPEEPLPAVPGIGGYEDEDEDAED